MGHNYVPHSLTLLTCQSQRKAAGVNSDTFVDKKTGQTLFGGCVALTIKGAG
jgi:hypothetical protein